MSGVPTATTGASLPAPYSLYSPASDGCSPKPRSSASAAAFGTRDVRPLLVVAVLEGRDDDVEAVPPAAQADHDDGVDVLALVAAEKA